MAIRVSDLILCEKSKTGGCGCGCGEGEEEGMGRARARARARVRVMMTMIHTTLRPKPKRKPNCTAAHSERHCCFTCQRCSGRWSEVAPQSLGSPAACYSCCACPLKAAYQARLDWPHLSNTCMKARVSQQRLSLPALLMSS